MGYVNQTNDWNASKITNFLESVLTIAVQEAFEDRDQDGDSDSEIFQDANSDFDDEENSSKPFMVRFFSCFGSVRKEKNTEPDDQIQSIITIREQHFDSAFELFV